MKNYINTFFTPQTIAVIGVSREEQKPGFVIFYNLLENLKKGKSSFRLYGINPFTKEILGQKIYSSILKVPEKIDLAIIVVPAKIVPKVLDECGKKGVKSVIIISAGFSEIGNVALEDKVKQIAQKYGIRIIGPNCLGVYDAYSGVDTIFLPYTKKLRDGRELISSPRPDKGYIAIISQSGALGLAILDYMAGEKIGLSSFVSYGNKIDVDEVDLLDFFMKDKRTRVIIMYLENIKRGREFIKKAMEVTTKKPIVVLKAGRTKAGAKATLSHTASLAGRDEVYNIAFQKSGIIRAYDLEELLDMAKALAYQPPAKGNRIAILTDGGGAGVLAADQAELLGLQVIDLSPQTKQKFKQLINEGKLVPYMTITNPIDLTGSATTQMYKISLEVLLQDPKVDAIVLLALHHIPGIPSLEELVEETTSVISKYKKPVVVGTIGNSPAVRYLREYYEKNHIPSYPTPERAVKALYALVKYGEYLKKRGLLEEYLKKWEKPTSKQF